MRLQKYKQLSSWTRQKVLRRDNDQCQDCGRGAPPLNISYLQIHHKIPVCDGGSDKPSNLITLCHPCHERADYARKSELVKAARAEYFAKRGNITKKRDVR